MFGPTSISWDRCCADLLRAHPHFQGHTSCLSRKYAAERDAPGATRVGSMAMDRSLLPITYNDRSNADVGLQTLSLHQFELSMPRPRKLPLALSFNTTFAF
jgi:hypothetical protein